MNATLVSGDVRPRPIDVRHVPPWQPLIWLYRGALDMRRHWGASLGYGGLVVALGWTLLIFGATHPYFIAAAITGFMLVGPIISAGLCEMSRRYAAGEDADFDDSLDGFVRNAHALFGLGAVLALAAVVWFAVSAVMLGTVFHVAAPDMQDTLYRGFVESSNRTQVLAYVLVGGVLAAAVFALSAVAIPIIVDRQATAGEGMRASVRAVLLNVPTMLVWSALLVLLTALGFLPLLFGLLFVAPLLGHATFHAYRDLIG